MKFLLGTKVNMTQIFDEKGIVHPATVIKTGPMTVTQVKTVETDGYNAVQVGFGVRNAKNINKALKGHMKEGNFANLVEFRLDDVSGFKVGDVLPLSFVAGDVVTTSSISKGKGFQGGVKRHGFKGGPRSHGQKHSEREPGSLGGGGRDGGRVAKGKRMAGRMGGDVITSKGLTIVSVNADTNEVFVRGAVAGRKGTLVEILG
ncbi:MAG TPA: 50S ribosomal protein L3 [Parcubacteria group bacterium]|jgi:large subunit ribosomal protein L3|nr:50S ribosomal protein L3 [Parcubacteria group bacterium]